MERQRPRVFIGSSSEGTVIARAIQGGLSSVAECTIWDQGIFELGKSTLDNLYEFIDKFDFAIFVATPDDRIELRGSSQISARDNVIFEIGLFMGGLGTDRVMFVTAGKIQDFKLPSDLAGITHVKYENGRIDNNVYAAVGPACLSLQRHIDEKSKIPGRNWAVGMSYAGAVCFRVLKEDIQYLLVNSTEKRRIFPKGDIKLIDKDAMTAASRIAKKEAGVRGRIINNNFRFVQYFNEEGASVHRIQVFLLDVSTALETAYEFRNPTWFNLTESITAITQGRDYNTSFELARAMEWADVEIRKFKGSFDEASAENRKKKKRRGK